MLRPVVRWKMLGRGGSAAFQTGYYRSGSDPTNGLKTSDTDWLMIVADDRGGYEAVFW